MYKNKQTHFTNASRQKEVMKASLVWGVKTNPMPGCFLIHLCLPGKSILNPLSSSKASSESWLVTEEKPTAKQMLQLVHHHHHTNPMQCNEVTLGAL